jgi:hypothetical protein
MILRSLLVACAAFATPGLCLSIAGCGSSYGMLSRGSDTPARQPPPDIKAVIGFDPAEMMAQQKLMQDLQTDPDLPAWHDQREKMALEIGDRVFDKSFDRTFDSMIIALANLGCRVNNMERISGYITSSLPELPPELSEQLKKQALSEYARAKGYPASLVETRSPFNVNMAGVMAEKMTAGVTLTMSRQGNEQTKVKLRFNNVYYPRTVEELYKRVWDAVDKQIFLDRTVG